MLRDRVTRHPLVAPLKPTWLRARRTTQPRRFFARETARRTITTTYALADHPRVRVALRHATPDVLTFDELFVQDIYAEPAPVRAQLEALGRPLVVADVGANVGMFAARTLAEHPAARVVCVEPDPMNLEVLRRCAAANGPQIEVVAAAAAVADGTVRFVSGQDTLSHVGDGPGAIPVAARDLFALAPDADLLKVDVEGAEWPLLADGRLAGHPARALTLEYHPQGAPDPADAPGCAHALLRAAGFHTLDVPSEAPPGYGLLWAWRPDGGP